MNIKQIGLSTSAFGYSMGSTGKNTDRKNPKPWTIEEFIDFANSMGFGGVEAPLMRFVPDLNPDRLKKIKSKLSEYKMFFIMDAEGALDTKEISALMPIAKEFSSPIIRIKSSSILECDRKKCDKPWIKHVEHCASSLKELAPKLREYGLRISVENHQDLDSSDLKQIVDSVGDDVVGVTFDIGNAFSVCEDPIEFAKKLGSRIDNIHLKEYKIFRSDTGFRLARCPVGHGAVDFKKALPLLAKNSPNAKVVVELGALEARNIGWLKPGFWEEIQARNPGELVAFFQLLEQNTIRSGDDSWKTPWERGDLPKDIVEYEIAELKSSIDYLLTI